MIKKILDNILDSVSWMNEKGYVAAWFSWLEWIGVTAVIIVLAKKTDSMLLYAIAIFSVMLLFFIGLSTIEKLSDEIMPMLRLKSLYLALISVLITGVGLQLIISILYVLLPASIT